MQQDLTDFEVSEKDVLEAIESFFNLEISNNSNHNKNALIVELADGTKVQIKTKRVA